jgi:transcriptional regulator with XRE-family HTH domain
MFRNVGRALVRLRERTGKTQTAIARAANIGKSQLWKYESGYEMPKLESLERVLGALGTDCYTFFWVLDLLDRGGPVRNVTRAEVSETFVRLTSELFMLHHEIIKELGDEKTEREVRP